MKRHKPKRRLKVARIDGQLFGQYGRAIGQTVAEIERRERIARFDAALAEWRRICEPAGWECPPTDRQAMKKPEMS